MGKIWLKSVDSSKQCCGCEGKSGPCDNCCSFDLTQFESAQTIADADTIFSENVVQCRAYFPDKTVKSLSNLGDPSEATTFNIVQSQNFNNPPAEPNYIDSDNIIFYHTDGYPQKTNGTLTILTKSKKKKGTEKDKIPPPREDFCAENKVKYDLHPPLEYDILVSASKKQGNDYNISVGPKTEVDKPTDGEFVEYPLSDKYTEIAKGLKLTTEICCNGTKFKFTQLFASFSETDICKARKLGIYKEYNFSKTDSAYGVTGNGNILISNLVFKNGKWRLDFKGTFLITDNPLNGPLSSVGMGVKIGENFLRVGLDLRLGTRSPAGTSIDGNVTADLGTHIQLPYPVKLLDFYGPFQDATIYIIPDCKTLFEQGVPKENDVGDIPDCDPNYACQKKDNIVKEQEILRTGGSNSSGDCQNGATNTDDLVKQVQDELKNNPNITPNLLGIIATSLSSLYAAGGIATSAAGIASLSLLGVFGLGLAAALVFYSIKQGLQEGNTDPNGNPTYDNNINSGEEDPDCSTIGEGNILKTTEQYSIVGKKILFPNDQGPPDDVIPYEPKYSVIATYSTSSGACVLINTKISRKQNSSTGFCKNTNNKYDIINIAYRSILSDNKKTHALMKPCFLKVDNKKYNCSID